MPIYGMRIPPIATRDELGCWGEDDEVLRPRALHRSERNARIECHKLATVSDCEGQQVHVGNLTSAVDVAGVDARIIQERHVVVPEFVMARCLKASQSIDESWCR